MLVLRTEGFFRGGAGAARDVVRKPPSRAGFVKRLLSRGQRRAARCAFAKNSWNGCT